MIANFGFFSFGSSSGCIDVALRPAVDLKIVGSVLASSSMLSPS